ncbi:poly(ADP-ribose) glycohydrolase isoform X1 [Cimex lectularius]|uniref:poly(ADP-ribose) glycohydrolase n=1 Tax=Cimex lectularius TaxID=79782 RepID=A0A8I6RRT3_CIMLE|nr:poly(ADP-ribose) glycohydrolase isoform X1 [Cimex lectularius]XP_014250219.1 poly(ADP-ribose) glycohydrolase isoform X1 [Cimex lectularius]XP_014250220.1 poly(ADP-ribose) glycohydrolase isoform X1 [Cimex lectularius]
MSLNSSQDMFEESSEHLSPQEDPVWLGVSLEDLKSSRIHTYPSIRPSYNHTVLFKLPLREGPPEPHPTKKSDLWDLNHVRMPHSPQSLYPVSETELKSRWGVVKSALTTQISTSKELEDAIFSYNSKISQQCNFDALHTFFSETLEPEESKYFFKSVLPGIINMALEIEDKFRGGIPFLFKGANRSISMSQEQVCILLANAFLCTFPRRNSCKNFPTINFNRLFQCDSLSSVQQKLKCFINYFRRIIKKKPKGIITFTRRHVKPEELPVWSEREEKFCKLHITSVGTIEDQGAGLMEVDFANKFVGGGVLGRGSVQEEIKFLICPELVVSRLFTECLGDTEAFIVTGCERFNKYVGYADTFTWSGNFLETELKRDSYNRLNSVVVAIDASDYSRNSEDQFSQESINRELNKAYSGFSFGPEGNIATGNWGCGVFNGDSRLKALLQIMAASVCKKGLAYFTFGDVKLRDDIFSMYTFLNKKDVNVGMLWQIISGYSTTRSNRTGALLYKYIYDMLETNLEKIAIVAKKEEETDQSEEDFVDIVRAMEEVESNRNVKTVNHKGKTVNSQNGECSSRTSLPQPKCAETYSLKTEEGRKRCLETEHERWEAYEKALNKFSIIDSRSAEKQKNTPKRKITDYFTQND